MPNKVLTSDNCDCGCGSGTNIGLQPGGDVNSLLDSFVVRNAPGILKGNVINKYNENGKLIYELDDLDIVAPGVTFTNDAPVIEVGATIAVVTFNGSIVETTSPIVSRTLNPNPGGLDLTAPFSFQKNNVKRTSPGDTEVHTLTAVDDAGRIKSVTSKVTVKNAIYMGYSDLPDLTQAQIKALVNKTLSDSVIAQYGGEQTYTVPNATVVPKYFYWISAVGTQAIAGAKLNGLTLPIVNRPNVNVTNIHDNTIIVAYQIQRTADKFDPGIYKITLS